MPRTPLLAMLVLLTGCALDLFDPPVAFKSRRPLEPVPAGFEELYHATETCLGMRGDFGAVEWWTADGIYTTHDVAGVVDGDEITIDSEYLGWDAIVRHESEHHVTGRGNDIHLPGLPFHTRCDGHAH